VSRSAAALFCAALVLAGCGAGRAAPAKQRPHGIRVGADVAPAIPASLRAGLRPIGRGRRFQPPIGGVPTGRCSATLGRRLPAHIEVFGANQVVLVPAGIGAAPPRSFTDGWLTGARCFGDVVTIGPGTVYFRSDSQPTLGTLFRAWGEPLTATRVASFTGGRTATYVDGRAWHGSPSAVPLRPGAEIVVEIGPHVPPHRHFVFAPPPSPRMR
jgi:hypothetical protein